MYYMLYNIYLNEQYLFSGWRNAQSTFLICFVNDFCLQRSVTGGLGSIQAEIMADTAVALTSANVQLVSRKVIGRLCRVSHNSDETCYMYCIYSRIISLLHIHL